MKRTLTFSLLLAMATLGAAQTPKVVEKSSGSAVKSKTDPQASSVSSKPSPAAVKGVPVTAQKTPTLPAKPAAVPAQPPTVKPVVVSAAKPNTASTPATAQATKGAPAKTNARAVSVQSVAAKANSGKSDSKTAAAKNPFSGQKKVEAVQVKTVSAAPAKTSAKTATKNAETSGETASAAPPRKVGAAGRRDPFISPVVSMSAVGSGCSSGKRCLAIEQISLRGVVRSETGMIAVVVNALDKAYFLRENDPVFNGFVEKITADSIVFKQTFHDRLGKPLTRDVTKTITRPAA